MIDVIYHINSWFGLKIIRQTIFFIPGTHKKLMNLKSISFFHSKILTIILFGDEY